MNQDEQDLRVKIVSAPESVPVFNCVVHLKNEGSSVIAKIANLDMEPFVAPNQVEAMKKAVQSFKQVMASSVAKGEDPPLIETVALEPDEECRLIPVHL